MDRQPFNQALYNQLPQSIRDSKEIRAVTQGSFPPYIIYDDHGNLTGVSIDIASAIAEILGVQFKYERVKGLPALLMGVASGKYDMAVGGVADFKERQKSVDFIDYILGGMALAVPKGNPQHIQTFADVCGKRLTSQTGGQAEKRAQAFSLQCQKEGKAPIITMTFPDQATSVLAVQSGRADAFFSNSALLAYYVHLEKSELDIVPVGLQDDFPYPPAYMGGLVAKNSPLRDIMIQALQELFDNGSYKKIMEKWHLTNNTIPAPGINLALE